MRTTRWYHRAVRAAVPLLAVVVAASAACGGGGGAVDAGACDAAAYPCGPYGLTAGSTIADLTFAGRRDDDRNGTAANDPVRAVSLDEYYAAPALRAIVLIVASETCVPCQNEQPTLLSLHARYGDQVAFIEAIVQGQAGQPADTSTLDKWAAQFGVPFDMTADPSGVLRPYYDASAFPATLVLRRADMQIVAAIAGMAGSLQAILDPLTG
jgi:hypothetical protein